MHHKARKPARRGVAFLLLIAVLCAAVVLRQRMTATTPRPSFASADVLDNGPPARLGDFSFSSTPAASHPARTAAAVTQGAFTLLAITRTQHGLLHAPPEVRAASTGFLGPALGGGDGTGLWIQVQGGLGIETLPALEGRHVWNVDGVTLVTLLHLHSPSGEQDGIAPLQWFAADGRTPLLQGKEPDLLQIFWAHAVQSRDGRPRLALLPRDLERHFRISAQPLNSQGLPLGDPIPLLYQALGTDLLLTQLPSAYSHETAEVEIRIRRTDSPATTALWRLVGLPRAIRQIPSSAKFVTQQTVGPLQVDASATEAPDQDGDATSAFPFFALMQTPFGIAGHLATGVPILRCRLRGRLLPPSRRAQPPAFPERWELQLQRVTPQWAPAPADASGMLPGLDIIRGGQYLPLLPDRNWHSLEVRAGFAYPGQQRRVRMDADAVVYRVRTEPLTFHDADIVRDAATGQWRLQWERPQTLQTASGITVTALNPRPHSPAPSLSGPPLPSAARGAVEMILACRFPRSMTEWPMGSFRPGLRALPLALEPPLTTRDDMQEEARWGHVWLPGSTAPPIASPHPPKPGETLRPISESPLYALIHAGSRALSILFVPKTPGPAHYPTVTVLVRTAVEVRRTPITLTVPVTPLPSASPVFARTARAQTRPGPN